MKIVEKKGKILGLGKSFELVKNKEIDDSLVLYEKTFLNSIFSRVDRFEIKGHKMYTIVEKVKTNIYESLVGGDFFPENPQTVRTTYYVWAGIALFTGNFHLAIIMFIFARIMPRKTLFGAGQAAVARSLKNFLVSQSRQLAFQAKNQMMFEKLLPYAIAYGVEKIWAERFKDLNLRKPDWYEGGSMTHFNSVLLATSLNNSFNSIRSSATPVRSSTGHSSGFSGGFSGGGGGGGGGGSW